MPVPSDEQISAAVTKSFANRGVTVSATERAVVMQTVRGFLRLPMNKKVPLDQAAQRMVDFLIAGIRDMPPYPYRPELEPLLRHTFEELEEDGLPMPSDTVISALVNLAIGWILERGIPTSPGARGAVARDFMNCYLFSISHP